MVKPNWKLRLRACWHLLTSARWVLFTCEEVAGDPLDCPFRMTWERPMLGDVDSIREWCDEVEIDTNAANSLLSDAHDILGPA